MGWKIQEEKDRMANKWCGIKLQFRRCAEVQLQLTLHFNCNEFRIAQQLELSPGVLDTLLDVTATSESGARWQSSLFTLRILERRRAIQLLSRLLVFQWQTLQFQLQAAHDILKRLWKVPIAPVPFARFASCWNPHHKLLGTRGSSGGRQIMCAQWSLETTTWTENPPSSAQTEKRSGLGLAHQPVLSCLISAGGVQFTGLWTDLCSSLSQLAHHFHDSIPGQQPAADSYLLTSIVSNRL